MVGAAPVLEDGLPSDRIYIRVYPAGEGNGIRRQGIKGRDDVILIIRPAKVECASDLAGHPLGIVTGEIEQLPIVTLGNERVGDATARLIKIPVAGKAVVEIPQRVAGERTPQEHRTDA